MTIKLTPEDRKAFEEFYRERIREDGATDYAGELSAARDLLQAVTIEGLTPVGDGSVSYVRRGAVDWGDPTTTAAAQNAVVGKRGSRVRRPEGGSSDVLQGLAVVVGMILAAVWWFWPAGDSNAVKVETTPAAVIGTTVTRVFDAAPTVAPTLEAALLADIVDSSGVKTGIVAPRTLDIVGVSFVVQPVQITTGDWPLPLEERAVSWVYGTVVNYVMGLQATPANKDLLKGLKPGDELLLRMSTGATYRFAFADSVRVSPQTTEVFRQSRPALTLVLLEDSGEETRVVLRANYIAASELGLAPEQAEIKAALGETVTLSEAVQVTAQGIGLLARPGAPPGYVYQAVAYQVKNIGDLALSTTSFKHHIESSLMNYPIVAVPHEENPYPLIPETLAAGAVFSTTAIYAVPQTALAEGLAWEFSPGPTGARVRVTLPPYGGRLAPLVEVTAVQLGGQHLQATFAISAALNALELGPNDIDLNGATFSPTGNFFPWRVPAGGSSEFLLLLTPGDSQRVTVSLLQQGFEFDWRE